MTFGLVLLVGSIQRLAPSKSTNGSKNGRHTSEGHVHSEEFGIWRHNDQFQVPFQVPFQLPFCGSPPRGLRRRRSSRWKWVHHATNSVCHATQRASWPRLVLQSTCQCSRLTSKCSACGCILQMGLRDAKSRFQEVHELAEHLLQTYGHAGKVFLLGAWELEDAGLECKTRLSSRKSSMTFECVRLLLSSPGKNTH